MFQLFTSEKTYSFYDVFERRIFTVWWGKSLRPKAIFLQIPKTYIVDGPKTFKFRGWFINDEDLLMGFSRGGVPERGYDFHKDYFNCLYEIISKISMNR